MLWFHNTSDGPMVFATAIVAALTLLGLGGQPAFAVTPESAEVKQVIERGLKFLETSQDERLGGKCLIGLAFLKNGRDRSHVKIVEALNACKQFAQNPSPANTPAWGATDNYSIGLAIIFLCEHDPVANRDAAQRAVNHLLSKQMPNGAWSYPNATEGDTSQTQYAALGLWMADATGLEVPQENVEKLCGWLLRTQDPAGGFGYHPPDPGNMTRQAQPDVRPSLVAAGLGSVYITADLLGITDPKEDPKNSGIPPVLKEVEQKQGKTKRQNRAAKVIDPAAVRRAMADGNAWFAKNFTVTPESWGLYYLYGLERYMSFRELAEGHAEREPDWYNRVFDHLRRTQQPSGSWQNSDSEVVSTSFAVLCLARSTRKAINTKLKALGEGVLLGGMGLPKNISDLQERNGKVVESPLGGSVEEILAIIEDPNNPELKRLAESGQSVALDNDITKRSGQVARLRSLVAAGNYESRLVAIKSLAKVRDLDNVPVLLFALTDPDVRIVLEADKAMRFVSRKFRGVGLPADPQPPGSDAQVPAGQWPQVKAAQKAWKDWYLSIRPDAELLD